jgi:hypothetical protein
MNRKLTIGIGAISLLLGAAAARAGMKSPGVSVTIGLQGLGSYFFGTMGAVRASANAAEYLGCSIQHFLPASATSNVVQCIANDGNGKTAVCTYTGPAEWNPLAGMTPSSHLDVSFDQNTGLCAAVRVSNPSFYPVIQP